MRQREREREGGGAQREREDERGRERGGGLYEEQTSLRARIHCCFRILSHTNTYRPCWAALCRNIKVSKLYH